MAKKVILETGKTFSEFSLLTEYTSKDCTLQNINLEAKRGGLKLRHPFLSAAMTSVTGYEMALALGKEGGLGVLPARLSIKEQVEIIKKIKGYEMGFVEDPITVRENATIDEVVRLVEKHGHSKVPIADRNNVFLGLFSFDKYLSFIEYFLGRSLINSDVYFISKIPAKIMINDVVVVSLFSLFISFLATIYPSYKASKTEPAIILKGN